MEKIFEIVTFQGGVRGGLTYNITRIERTPEGGHQVAAVCWSPVDAKRICAAMNLEKSEEQKALEQRVAHLEMMRPHWAKGHSSDSVAAQLATDALAELWKVIGADNQTEAMAIIKRALSK